MSEDYDALVVGGGAEGLVAAALLAKAGLRTLLLERSAVLTDPVAGADLRGLDPVLVKRLRLARHGLGFAVRDLSLTVLHQGGVNAVIGRDRYATARSLAALSQADAKAHAGFRRELFTLARALRPAWWSGAALEDVLVQLKPEQHELFERLRVTSALAWLASHFESDPLRAAVAFTAAECGAAPSEAGSALALVWAAAQEMCGLQGAAAVPQGGVLGLLRALTEAAHASGAEIRTNTAIARLTTAGGAVTGAELLNGERIAAPLILSALGRRDTLLGLLPPGEIGLGATRALNRPAPSLDCATLVFTLAPEFAVPRNTRAVIAERPEIYEAALAAARLGTPPREPALELVALPQAAGEPGPRLLSVRAWPSQERNDFVPTVTAMIERHMPGFAQAVKSCDVLAPPAGEPFGVERLLAGARARIDTPLRGLFLCGADAEPLNALCGRAARQAADFAIAEFKRAR